MRPVELLVADEAQSIQYRELLDKSGLKNVNIIIVSKDDQMSSGIELPAMRTESEVLYGKHNVGYYIAWIMGMEINIAP